MLAGIRMGLATVQAQGYGTPASVVLNPADLAAIDLSIMGSTMSGPQLNNSVWGLNFIPTPGVAVNTAYVGDLGSAVQLFRRANASIFLTDSHGEFFISNIVLILAEIRATVAVSRAGGAGGSNQDPLMAADLAGLKEFLGMPPATTTDEAAMQSALDAANDYVSTLRPDLTGAEPWPRPGQPGGQDGGGPPLRAAWLDVGQSRRSPTSGSLSWAGWTPTSVPCSELGEYQPSVVA